MLIQDCCTHEKGFIENLKDIYSDDQYMDEEILEILHEYSFQKERQTNCHDIQENPQSLVMSSLTKIDISQSFDSASYFYFHEATNSSQNSCESLCDQEGSWDYHSDFSLYHSAS